MNYELRAMSCSLVVFLCFKIDILCHVLADFVQFVKLTLVKPSGGEIIGSFGLF